MKRIWSLVSVLLLLLGAAVAVFQPSSEAQSAGTIQVSEADGQPNVPKARWIVFPNSSLSCSSGKCTYTGISSTITAADTQDAVLTLQADNSDDNGDDWTFVNAASDNSLSFKNDTSGSAVTKLALSTAGVITLADSETLTNSADALILTGDDNDTTFEVLGFEAKTAILKLFADQDDDATDGWFFTATTSGTLTIGNDSSAAGTAVTKLTITGSNGNVALVGALSGDGGDALVGFLQSQVAATATTLTVAQCGATIINTGAVQVELPEASTALGCRYTFITGNAANFDINPDNGDQILVITNAAGDAMRNATLGNSITIEAISASQWAPVGKEQGTWSDIN